MTKGVLAIYEEDLTYASRLMDYLNQEGEFILEARIFTNMESLTVYSEKNPVAILLVGEGMDVDALLLGQCKQILILTGTKNEKLKVGYPAIFKYQSVEHLKREIEEHYWKQDNCNNKSHLLTESDKMQLLGVFSPCGGSGKSIFALALGQVLAKERRVLYMNLEAIPAQYHNTGSNGNQGMSDLIYYIKQKKSDLAVQLKSMCWKIGEMDYLLPVDHYTDLYELNSADVYELIKELKNSCFYEAIVLDLGYLSGSVFDFLKLCDVVYIPTTKNKISDEKEEALSKILQVEEQENLLQKFISVQIPFDERIASGNYSVDQLCTGQLGDYVSQLIRNEEEGEQ